MSGSKRFKTTFLHIGLGKTGTTSIQADLLAEADVLESAYDLHFPRAFPPSRKFNGNHSFFLRALFQQDPETNARLAAHGLTTRALVEAYNKETRQGMLTSAVLHSSAQCNGGEEHSSSHFPGRHSCYKPAHQ